MYDIIHLHTALSDAKSVGKRCPNKTRDPLKLYNIILRTHNAHSEQIRPNDLWVFFFVFFSIQCIITPERTTTYTPHKFKRHDDVLAFSRIENVILRNRRTCTIIIYTRCAPQLLSVVSSRDFGFFAQKR